MPRTGIRKPNGPWPGGTGSAEPVAWRMEALGAPPGAQREAPPPPPRPPEEELARIREQARAEGHAAGLAEGRAAAAQETAELGALLGRLREVMEEHEQALAADVMGVAVELARQVMRHALHVHPEVVLPVVREAIASLPQGSQHPRLLLHPQDAALVRSVLDANQLTPAPWRIVEDARLERGGCRIETAASELDASLGARWKAVLGSLGREERWVELEAPKRGAGPGGTGEEPSAAAGRAPGGASVVPPPRPREAG